MGCYQSGHRYRKTPRNSVNSRHFRYFGTDSHCIKDCALIDPCCGSGGMFVQSIKFVEAHSGNKKEVSIYGQEYTNTTSKLAKMNLAIRGISANLGEMAANTFTNDQHKDLKADFIMANPPFNQKQWRAENEFVDDPRWNGYEVPPTSNANYGWILNIVSKLSQNGVAGFLLANVALSDDGTELKIRQQLIENHLVEAIIILPRNHFYTTDISVILWVLSLETTFEIEHIYARNRNEKEDSLTDARNVESLGNKALLEKRINIRASAYRFTDNKKYYEGFTNSRGQIKEGTGVVELLDLTATSADFTEKDIIDRYKKMIDCFINYLQKNGLLK